MRASQNNFTVLESRIFSKVSTYSLPAWKKGYEIIDHFWTVQLEMYHRIFEYTNNFEYEYFIRIFDYSKLKFEFSGIRIIEYLEYSIIRYSPK